MASIAKGTTFTDGVSANAAALNNLVDAATILPGIITDRGAVAPDPADSLLIYDTSGSGLAKCTLQNVIDAFPTDAVAATKSLRTLGTGAQQAVAGNDSRIPASVTGIRKGAGAGGTDVAATPKDFAFTPVNLNGSLAINWDAADVFYDTSLTGSAARTYTFSNVRVGRVITVILFNMAGFTGSITWPALSGTAPAADHGFAFNVFTFIHTGNNVLGLVKGV